MHAKFGFLDLYLQTPVLHKRALGICLHPLVDRDGVRLLLRLLRHPPERGSQTWGSLVPKESQRPGFQPDPRDDPLEHTQAHAQVNHS